MYFSTTCWGGAISCLDWNLQWWYSEQGNIKRDVCTEVHFIVGTIPGVKYNMQEFELQGRLSVKFAHDLSQFQGEIREDKTSCGLHIMVHQHLHVYMGE